MLFMRETKLHGLMGLLLLFAGTAVAQDGTAPFQEFDKKIDSARKITPIGDNPFGENISLFSGAVEFTVTDIDIPGNNALPVALSRRFVLGHRSSQYGWQENNWFLGGFADWDVEVPYIEGTFSSAGWIVDNPADNTKRCSTLKAPVEYEQYFQINDFWSGNSLHIPGDGNERVYAASAALPKPADGKSYPWVTTSQVRLGCLAQTKNGYPGEAFIAITPDGNKYYLDWATERGQARIKGPGMTQGSTVYADRKQVFLLASRVEDRFGNWVSYTYNGGRLTKITASDGRSIEVTYTNDQISQATANNRTWSYAYAGNSAETDGGLSVVTLPSGEKWSYQKTGRLKTPEVQKPPKEELDFCGLWGWRPIAPFTMAVTTPSGLRGEFTVEMTRNLRWGAQECGPPNPPWYDLWSLKKKVVSGIGVPQQTTTYAIAGHTDGNPWRWTTVTHPDGSRTEYRHGTRPWDTAAETVESPVNEGLLLEEKEVSSAGVVIRDKIIEYQNVPQQTTPFLRLVCDPNVLYYCKRDAFVRPVKKETITQDGVTFTNAVAANSFDSFARALSRTKSSTLGYSRTEVTAYHDNLAKWVLGQIKSVTCTAPASCAGKVISQVDYDSVTAAPLRTYAFGSLQQALTYYSGADATQVGTISTMKDGNSNVTTLSGWFRGTPQTITYADLKTVKSVVESNGWVKEVTDENGVGYTTKYSYDGMGRLTLIDYPDGDSVQWNSTTMGFTQSGVSAYGLPVGHWQKFVSTGNASSFIHYDANLHPVVEESWDTSDPNNTRSVVVKRYDIQGRLAFQSYPVRSITTINDVLKGTTTTYDDLDRVKSVTEDSELGPLVTKTEYLPGFITRVTNPRMFKVLTKYLAYNEPILDWPVTINHADGALENASTDITRDAFGKPTSIRRRNTDGSLSVTRYFVYNDHQQLCKTVEPETGAQHLLYDDAGNLLKTTLAPTGTSTPCEEGISSLDAPPTGGGLPPVQSPTITRTYDSRNRLKTLVFSDGGGNQSWTYTPDGLPETVTAVNPKVTNPTKTTYVYNKRRLMTGEGLSHLGNAAAWGIGYGYDANGSLSTLFYPSGMGIAYDPNALGQPRKVGTYASGIRYYPNGAIAEFTYGNGIKHTMTQNVRLRPSRSLDEYGTTKFLDDTYTFDGNSNVATIRDGLPGARGNRDMTYDGLDRLIKVKSTVFGAGAEQSAYYSYDALDNLTGVVVGGPKPRIRQYCYDYKWRLTNIKDGTCTDGSTVVGLGYDNLGNLSNKNGQTFHFDVGNRLRSSWGPDYWYAYDGQGRRVLSCSTTACMYQQYSNSGQLLATDDFRIQKRFEPIYLAGSMIAIKESNPANGALIAVKYQHTDALGSPMAVTDQNRVVVQKSEYEPYGLQIANRPAADGPGYAGHVFDATTGMSYMQQRYYDPEIGRFLSVDPVTANAQTGVNFNRYWYANNNPYKYTDPDGRCPAKASKSVCIDSKKVHPTKMVQVKLTPKQEQAVKAGKGVVKLSTVSDKEKLASLNSQSDGSLKVEPVADAEAGTKPGVGYVASGTPPANAEAVVHGHPEKSMLMDGDSPLGDAQTIADRGLPNVAVGTDGRAAVHEIENGVYQIRAIDGRFKPEEIKHFQSVVDDRQRAFNDSGR